MKPVYVLLVSFGLFFSSGLLAQHAPIAEKNPLSGNASAAEAGRKTYVNSCQVCHGGDGAGGRGPALATREFRHGGEDWQLFQTIRDGLPGTQMPGFGMSPEELWQVVTYLRTLTPAGKEEAIQGDAMAGEKVFFGKGACQLCHQVNGRGGRVGPDLSTAGQWTVQALREVIVNPNEQEGRRPNAVYAKTYRGEEIRGIQKNEDTFSIQLMDMADQFHLLLKKDLAEFRYEDKSLMPDNYAKQLSPEELRDLLVFLKTLKVRDLAKVAAAPSSGEGLLYNRIRNSQKEPQNWLTYWGDYQGRHFSSLKHIHTANVKGLQSRWAWQFSGAGVLQATPLVEDGVMYTTGASGYVYALDARTGKLLWQYQHRLKSAHINTNATSNRGVAKLGERLFFVTADAGLSALDAKTGRVLWHTVMADVEQGYFGTMAPLALKDKIIVGISGGEFGVRGFIDAYDPMTGQRLWRFHTVPGPGEFGNDTWSGDSWKRGGGATWMTGTYDPELDLIYWGVGNPAPDMNGDVRLGDNLFTCAIVALEAATGKRRWHFQFTPHDTHDWDSNEVPVLVDRMFQGKMRKLLLHADRNAFFYVLDRITGEFLLGKPFARQTWAKSLDTNGRPLLVPNSEASVEGQLHYPGLAGATNWQAPSYDPATGWLYVAFRESGDVYYKEDQEYEPGKPYWGGKVVSAKEREWGGVKAINPETGKIEWEYKLIAGNLSAGVLATGGGVLFVGSREGNLLALESRSGKLLWRFQVGSDINSSPMSYAIDGQQYIGISAGKVLYSFALPEDSAEAKPTISKRAPKTQRAEPASKPKLLGVEVGAQGR
ncbi:MAG: PQQ-dependent dehydrogenase, methanol/ethanol family [Acidobacteria bacterium]|nr:PQQ-dependent dehydrogenase, methanol/ethanol family [Acidobacteriota bacterium]MCI0721807.1 PQQ-dependent dehydrogenase, methanol/ethanol family [Acidobacteriota bacterium]